MLWAHTHCSLDTHISIKAWWVCNWNSRNVCSVRTGYFLGCRTRCSQNHFLLTLVWRDPSASHYSHSMCCHQLNRLPVVKFKQASRRSANTRDLKPTVRRTSNSNYHRTRKRFPHRRGTCMILQMEGKVLADVCAVRCNFYFPVIHMQTCRSNCQFA